MDDTCWSCCGLALFSFPLKVALAELGDEDRKGWLAATSRDSAEVPSDGAEISGRLYLSLLGGGGL